MPVETVGGRTVQFEDTFTFLFERSPTRYARMLHMEEPWGSAGALRIKDQVMTVLKTRAPGPSPFIDGKTELSFKFKVKKALARDPLFAPDRRFDL